MRKKELLLEDIKIILSITKEEGNPDSCHKLTEIALDIFKRILLIELFRRYQRPKHRGSVDTNSKRRVREKRSGRFVLKNQWQYEANLVALEGVLRILKPDDKKTYLIQDYLERATSRLRERERKRIFLLLQNYSDYGESQVRQAAADLSEARTKLIVNGFAGILVDQDGDCASVQLFEQEIWSEYQMQLRRIKRLDVLSRRFLVLPTSKQVVIDLMKSPDEKIGRKRKTFAKFNKIKGVPAIVMPSTEAIANWLKATINTPRKHVRSHRAGMKSPWRRNRET